MDINKHMQLALLRAKFSNIDVKVPDRVALELILLPALRLHVWQA